MTELLEQERLVDQHVKENNIEAAVKLLFNLIVIYAEKKDFIKADALRDRLLEVDPMALNEIMKSGDIIEEGKTKSMDQAHLSAWSGLYNTLSSEETYALYYAMKERVFEPLEIVFEQGDKRPNLYFIDQGELKMTYSREGQETLIKKIGAGDFAGDDTFFSTTVSNSVSLITESQVTLRFLEKNILRKWNDSVPELDRKLNNYCMTSGTIHDVMKDMNLNRRTHERIKISGIGTFQLLNKSGEAMGNPFKGTLSDISVGGICFLIRILKIETARLLLNRKLSIKFAAPIRKDHQTEIDQVGTIVGVRGDAFGEYSMHVKFDQLLSEELLQMVKRSALHLKA